MRRAGRTDSNQNTVVAALRKVGASVAITSGVGHGFPDLCVGHKGATYLLELKDENKPPSQRRLTKDEALWHKRWNGHVAVVESPKQALEAIGAK